MRIFLSLAMAALAAGADSYPVLSTPAGDHLVLDVRGLPVAFGLAHLEVPSGQQTAARDALTALTTGKRVEIVYLADFGTDPGGSARVQALVGTTLINEELVARGLARYQQAKAGSAAENSIRRAQDKAQKAGLGLWKNAADGPSVLATAPVKPAAAPKPGTAALARGPFCSELDNQFYYPVGAREVANVSPQRLIFYLDEATARKAGKIPPVKVEVPLRGSTLADADAAYDSGRKICADAISRGNSTARDELYAKAYAQLTQSMQIYSDLVERNPNDDALAEKLHACMQLRYGTVKYRRFE